MNEDQCREAAKAAAQLRRLIAESPEETGTAFVAALAWATYEFGADGVGRMTIQEITLGFVGAADKVRDRWIGVAMNVLAFIEFYGEECDAMETRN